MLNQAQTDTTATDRPSEGGSSRSRIAFPYSALDSVIQVVEVLHQLHGTQCELAQLAGALNTTVESGTFRSTVSAARTFGLIRTKSKIAELTDLGIAIVDSSTCDEAKVEAFLSVPLYQSIYDKFEGRRLPPDAGLEAEIRSLGVTEKSVARARQALQRSAVIAGFSRSGKDRLVRPPAGRGNATSVRPISPASTTTEPPTPRPAQSAVASSIHDELLSALWSKLPMDGNFPDPRRSQWLEMLKLALDMVYGSAQTDRIDDEPF